MNIQFLPFLIQEIFKNIERVDESDFKEYIEKAINLVNDSSDSPIVALAIKQKPCTIVTKNKRDFKIDELKKIDIEVFTPHETLENKFNISLVSSKTRVKKKGLIYKFVSFLSFFKRI